MSQAANPSKHVEERDPSSTVPGEIHPGGAGLNHGAPSLLSPNESVVPTSLSVYGERFFSEFLTDLQRRRPGIGDRLGDDDLSVIWAIIRDLTEVNPSIPDIFGTDSGPPSCGHSPNRTEDAAYISDEDVSDLPKDVVLPHVLRTTEEESTLPEKTLRETPPILIGKVNLCSPIPEKRGPPSSKSERKKEEDAQSATPNEQGRSKKKTAPQSKAIAGDVTSRGPKPSGKSTTKQGSKGKQNVSASDSAPRDEERLRLSTLNKMFRSLQKLKPDTTTTLQLLLGVSKPDVQLWLANQSLETLQSWSAAGADGQIANILEQSGFLDQERFSNIWKSSDLVKEWYDSYVGRVLLRRRRAQLKPKNLEKTFSVPRVSGAPSHVVDIQSRLLALDHTEMQNLLAFPGVPRAAMPPLVTVLPGPKILGSGHWVKVTIKFSKTKWSSFKCDRGPASFLGKMKFQIFVTSFTKDDGELPVLCASHSISGFSKIPDGTTCNPVTEWKIEKKDNSLSLSNEAVVSDVLNISDRKGKSFTTAPKPFITAVSEEEAVSSADSFDKAPDDRVLRPVRDEEAA
jgi:hypothetical protein